MDEISDNDIEDIEDDKKESEDNMDTDDDNDDDVHLNEFNGEMTEEQLAAIKVIIVILSCIC